MSLEVLRSLHEHHLCNVPFENVAIWYGEGVSMDAPMVYHKVVEKQRGGFCYELNLLFHQLLGELGFTSSIVAARVFNTEGELGPPFDHLFLLVELDQLWLVDVGFGDLFLQPIAMHEAIIQTDGRNYFKVEKYAQEEYLLLMSSDKTTFERKYTFSITPRRPSDFALMCQEKQTNPTSHFVKNKICTRVTPDGRMTVFNDKFIHKMGEQKVEYLIEGEEHCKEILKSHFNIVFE